MDVAKEWVNQHLQCEVSQVILADEQTHGRGKPGNHWVSPPGNLYATLIFPHAFSPKQLTELSFLTTIAIGETLVKLNPSMALSYKWPNDILINEEKVGGILLEPFASSTLIGMGINLIMPPPLLKATCLKDHGISLTALDLIKHILHSFGQWKEIWEKKSFEEIRLQWLGRAFRLHQTICVKIGPHAVEGLFENIDKNGNLRLIEKDGTERLFASGDIFII